MPLFPTTTTSPSPAPENMVAGVPMQPTNHPTSKLHLHRTLTAPVLVWLLALALALASLLLLPALRPSPPAAFSSLNLAANSSSARCDVFRGQWVRDFTYPLYNSSACPFAERGFNCQSNGRRDRAYQTWRWRPRGCDLPRFDPRAALERLRGKRVVFVGDSMSRTQWESLICLLMPAAGDPASVYEVNGNRITKQIRFLGARFKPFNFTIEFFRSVFLVQQGSPPKHSPKRVRSVLRLDELDDMSRRWIDADVLVFNSGQWWNHGKLFGTGLYFQVNGLLKLGMPISAGFKTALHTWAAWLHERVDTNRTRVFFRTVEPSHWRTGAHPTCTVTHYPLKDPEGHDKSMLSDIIKEVIETMKAPVTILDVTPLGSYRSDAHVGRWSDTPTPDCSHWCLPGVPDVWNELIFSHLLGSV